MAFSNDQFRLDGKVAIVTGAGGRGNSIGGAYAKGLAQAGAQVVVADLNLDGAKSVAAEIGDMALPLRVDIADEASVAAMVEETVRHFGGLDILVNNAALMVEAVGTPAIQTEISAFERLLRVNLLGALICAKSCVAAMCDRGGGRIVNQVSAGAYPAQTPYGVSKLALAALTTTLATELGPLGINVNAIAPGITLSDAGKIVTPDDNPYVQALMARAVMRAQGVPDELVGTLLLLCSPAGAWITGQIINVDGGLVLRD